ncbi:hypothetical protein [Nocardioides sp.]|jgi:hypothetical protein|uniref:hypothetical protein n=1 Tax=Nocardioides sp. TaxID=35761 RepID=UPI0031FF3EAF|nr:Pentapeptide repeat protein [Nocardioides sp.]
MQFKKLLNNRVTAVIGGAAVVAILGSSAGYAAGQIGSEDIQNDSIRGIDVMDGTLKTKDLSDGAYSAFHGLSGYEVNTYDYIKGVDGNVYGAGDAAIATVACTSQSKVAVSGGYQILNSEAMTDGTTVLSSFPGRMDWSANPPAPLPNRNDGWILQLNVPDGTSDTHIGRDLRAWVICVDAN